MKINMLILAVVLTLAGLWTYLDQKKQSPNRSTPTYADFELNALNGKKHTFYDYKARITLVHFWATWCTPCLKELPELIELASRNPKKITVLAFAVADKPEEIHAFLSKANAIPPNFIIGLDTNKNISENIFGTEELPETFILSSKLTLKDKITGAHDDWIGYFGNQ